MSEDEIVNKYFEQIQKEIYNISKEDIIQHVYSLMELIQMLIEKIKMATSEKQDSILDFEAQNQKLKDEIQFQQQLMEQMQHSQDDLLQKSEQMYEKIITLEEDLKQQQILNSIYKNQFEIKQIDKTKVAAEEAELEINEQKIENEHLKQQIASLKNMIYENKSDYQSQLFSNQRLIQHQESIIQSLKEDLSNQRSQVRILKSENRQMIDQINEKRSALKEISNSPFLQNGLQHQSISLRKEIKETRDYVSSQKRYLQVDEIYDVNQFTILESELEDTNFYTNINTQCRNSFNFKKVQLLDQASPPLRNIYKDFFNLTSQCVKLNMNNDSILDIQVSHLFEKYVEQKIPFHQWYYELKQYLIQFQ